MRAAVVISGGANVGASTLAGCGSNVSTTVSLAGAPDATFEGEGTSASRRASAKMCDMAEVSSVEIPNGHHGLAKRRGSRLWPR